jgi:4-hydroxybenzoate polyprenyltransferase
LHKGICRLSGQNGLTEIKSGVQMLYTIVVVLLVLWLLGLVGNIGGGLIHLLLVVAAIVFIYQLVIGRRKL